MVKPEWLALRTDDSYYMNFIIQVTAHLFYMDVRNAECPDQLQQVSQFTSDIRKIQHPFESALAVGSSLNMSFNLC